MAYEQILSETRGRVGIMRLNRPDKLNAWTDQMAQEMRHQIDIWNNDPGIGAFLITGEGRAFCAGADMGSFGQRLERRRAGPEPLDARFGGALSYWTDFVMRSKPSVIAFNGYAVGVGLTMGLPCDVRIADEGAQLSIRFVRVGLIPELCSTRILSQLVGLGLATDMCLTGRFVGAEEALRAGLVTAVVPPPDLLDAGIAKAEELANSPTDVALMIKDLLRVNPLEQDLETVSEREQVRDRIARAGPAHAEAVRAFQEKREPRFN